MKDIIFKNKFTEVEVSSKELTPKQIEILKKSNIWEEKTDEKYLWDIRKKLEMHYGRNN